MTSPCRTEALHGRILGFNVTVAHVWAEQQHLVNPTKGPEPVEGVSASERVEGLVLVESHRDAGGAQCLANALRRFPVLRRVREEHGFVFRGAHFSWSSASPIWRSKTSQRGSEYSGVR